MKEKTGISLNVVKKLTIKSKADGADKTSAKLKRLQAAYEGNAKAFDRFLDAERRFEAAERSRRQ